MTPKKRKPRTVVTDATKAKLPKPTRKRPPLSAPKVALEGPRPRKRREMPKRVQCPRCEKLVPSGPHDIHTCYDAKALREAEARAIPCGEDVPPVIAVDWPWGGTITRAGWSQPFPSPIAEQNPWPVRVLNWLDEAPTKARRRIAAWLRALAGRVDA